MPWYIWVVFWALAFAGGWGIAEWSIAQNIPIFGMILVDVGYVFVLCVTMAYAEYLWENKGE